MPLILNPSYFSIIVFNYKIQKLSSMNYSIHFSFVDDSIEITMYRKEIYHRTLKYIIIEQSTTVDLQLCFSKTKDFMFKN